MGSGAPAAAWGEGGDRTHPRRGPRNWGLRGPGVAAGLEGEARPTRTRDDVRHPPGSPRLDTVPAPASPPLSAGFLGSRSHPGSLDRPRRREGAGGPKTMGRGRGSKLGSSPLALRRVGAPRLRSAQGTPPPAARRAQGGGSWRLWEDGTAARAHLDEELDDGLFVLLLQPVQRHRQRHGRFGWACFCSGTALATGSRRAAAPWTVLASSLPQPPRLRLVSSAPPHAPRARLRRPQPRPLQVAGAGHRGGVSAGGGAKGRSLPTLQRKSGRPELGGVASAKWVLSWGWGLGAEGWLRPLEAAEAA